MTNTKNNTKIYSIIARLLKLMTISTIIQTKTLAKHAEPSDSQNIVTLYENTGVLSPLPEDTSVITSNSFLKNLKAYVSMKSLEGIPFPDIQTGDTRMQKISKTAEQYWNAPRKQLVLWIAKDNFSWFQVADVVLYKQNAYPYLTLSLMDYYTDNLAMELGQNGKLGYSIIDVGYGGLVANDTVNFYGNVVEEYIVDRYRPTITYQNYSNSVGSTGFNLIPANTSRKSFSITNATNNPLYLAFTENRPTSISGYGLMLLANGGNYTQSELEASYQGNVWAWNGLTTASTGLVFVQQGL